MRVDPGQAAIELFPTRRGGKCDGEAQSAPGCNPTSKLGDTTKVVRLVVSQEEAEGTANSDGPDQWPLRECLVGRAIDRCWTWGLSDAEIAVLRRLLTFTLAERRHFVQLPLSRLLEGWDENGDKIALSMALSLTVARFAVSRLKSLGLITTQRVGKATRFTINSDEIIDGGRFGSPPARQVSL